MKDQPRHPPPNGVTTELTFEQAQKELERVVAELESGRASLEDAVALWERGEELYRFCLGKLDGAEGRVEELWRRAGRATSTSS